MKIRTSVLCMLALAVIAIMSHPPPASAMETHFYFGFDDIAQVTPAIQVGVLPAHDEPAAAARTHEINMFLVTVTSGIEPAAVIDEHAESGGKEGRICAPTEPGYRSMSDQAAPSSTLEARKRVGIDALIVSA